MKAELNSAAIYSWTTQAKTKSRQDFIKLSQMLARAIDKIKLTNPDNITEILILGMGGCGKSLVADSMIYEFFDYWDEECVPFANKMCFEHRPVDASRSPVMITDDIAGIETDICFYSNHKAVSNYKRGIIDNIEGIKKGERPLILFLSGILEPNDCLGTSIKIEIRRTSHIRPWSHIWNISIEELSLQTPDMQRTLKKIEERFPHPNFFRKSNPSTPLVS